MASQKNRFLTRAGEIIKKNPSVFKALEEFEKTGKLVTKKRMNFTLDREVSKNFRDYCKKHNLNMSEIIENLILKFSKEQ